MRKVDTFLRELDALNFATVNFKYKKYNPDLYDTTDNIQYVWQGMEAGIILIRFKNIDKKIMIVTIILLIITAYVTISFIRSLVFFLQ